MTDLSQPCAPCLAGEHDRCVDACGCLADHADDSSILRGFKRLKRLTNPEREQWVAGGWSRSSSAAGPAVTWARPLVPDPETIWGGLAEPPTALHRLLRDARQVRPAS